MRDSTITATVAPVSRFPRVRHVRCHQFLHGALLALALTSMLRSGPQAAQGQNPGPAPDGYQIAPPPSWVAIAPTNLKVPAPRAADSGGISEGVYYRLVERQVHAEQSEHYHRFVDEFLTVAGLQKHGHIEIEFDPAYQSLSVHSVKLHRGGETIDAFDPDSIRLLRSEDALTDGLLKGHAKLLILLPGAQVGDILDYSYTLSGDNPFFGGVLVDQINLQWETQVGEVRYRLVKSPQRMVSWNNHRTDIAPSKSTTADRLDEWVWQSTNTPAVFSEARTPEWYLPHAFVQLSEFSSWNEVARLGRRFFDFSSHPLSPDLAKAVTTIADAHPEAEDRALMAIRMVQNSIRYLGLEEGRAAFCPTAPNVTFARRYGDCKDKTVLLARMLEELGITSTPIYTHLNGSHRDFTWLPSPLAFDHVILRIALEDGSHAWVDTTLSRQGGSLRDLNPGDFEFGLPITDNAKESISIDQLPSSAERSMTEITETFRVGDVGEPSQLSVVTVYRRAKADEMRSYFEATHPTLAQRGHLAAYLDDFPNAKTAEAMVVDDHFSTNELTVTESYDLDNLWTKDDNGDGYHSIYFYLDSIRDSIAQPSAARRKTPLEIDGPHDVRQRLTIELPADQDWQFDAEDHFIEENGLRFERSVRQHDKSLLIDARLQTTADHVAAENIASFIDTTDAILALSSYSVWRLIEPDSPDPVDTVTAASSSSSGWLIGGALMAGCAIGAIGHRVFQGSSSRQN